MFNKSHSNLNVFTGNQHIQCYWSLYDLYTSFLKLPIYNKIHFSKQKRLKIIYDFEFIFKLS